MNERRFGVEIECGRDYSDESSTGRARRLLQRAGLDHWAETNIHSDGSGCEIPSPILQGRKGFAELKQVMDLLVADGFFTGRPDGMHVHHEASEWRNNTPLIAHTIELWEANLALVRRFVDPRRATSAWCMSHNDGEIYPDQPVYREAWEEFKLTKDPEKIRGTKYRALNTRALTHKGTIEIRLHEGTLNYNKAAAWVRFGQAFLDFALATFEVGEIVTCSSRTALLKHVKVSAATRAMLMAAQPQAATRNRKGQFVAA